MVADHKGGEHQSGMRPIFTFASFRIRDSDFSFIAFVLIDGEFEPDLAAKLG